MKDENVPFNEAEKSEGTRSRQITVLHYFTVRQTAAQRRQPKKRTHFTVGGSGGILQVHASHKKVTLVTK